MKLIFTIPNSTDSLDGSPESHVIKEDSFGHCCAELIFRLEETYGPFTAEDMAELLDVAFKAHTSGATSERTDFSTPEENFSITWEVDPE